LLLGVAVALLVVVVRMPVAPPVTTATAPTTTTTTVPPTTTIPPYPPCSGVVIPPDYGYPGVTQAVDQFGQAYSTPCLDPTKPPFDEIVDPPGGVQPSILPFWFVCPAGLVDPGIGFGDYPNAGPTSAVPATLPTCVPPVCPPPPSTSGSMMCGSGMTRAASGAISSWLARSPIPPWEHLYGTAPTLPACTQAGVMQDYGAPCELPWIIWGDGFPGEPQGPTQPAWGDGATGPGGLVD
jgi:hypothetical protein